MKKSTSAILAAILILTFSLSTFAFSQSEITPGEYSVPIVSLTTKAPIPAIKTAFAKAFGDSVTVEANTDGCWMTIENRHMSITVFGKTYEANVMTMEGAQVLSTKEETFSKPVAGLLGTPEMITETVPAQFRIPMALNDSGAQVLTITVDFMDEFMGRGSPHPSDVTLTLDMSAFAQSVPATTAAPTTQVPTTAAETTSAPTTQAPTTVAETTAAPTTQVPTTAAPETTAVSTTETIDAAPSADIPATTEKAGSEDDNREDISEKIAKRITSLLWVIILVPIVLIASIVVVIVIIVKKKRNG